MEGGHVSYIHHAYTKPCTTTNTIIQQKQEIHATLVAPLPKGVRLTAVFDSCHSGSVLDVRDDRLCVVWLLM